MEELTLELPILETIEYDDITSEEEDVLVY
jgi:hypothetical protein